MSVTDGLKPESVFGYFGEISAIPRGSGNTAEIADYLVNFARVRGLEHYRDAHDNVIIIKQASAGAKSAEPLILQGHTDMVCEKSADCKKDMTREGLDLAVDGDFIYAEGTTLGGDDGIAVAMMLALLDSTELKHPRLEAVFTSDEEIGMFGAATLDVSPLRGKMLMNIDSEDEGVFTVGCAGGCNALCRIPITRGRADGELLEITVDGLVGGHSGVEINKGRANADKLMGRLLYALSEETEIHLVYVDGGLKDNAIPCRAAAQIYAADAAAVGEACERLQAFERIQSMRQQCADKGRGGRECGVCANGRGKHPPRRCNACVYAERSAENERGNRRNGGNIAQSGDTEDRGELC